eukprot:m51a1_g10714 putative nitrite reductase (363) ;mRNA; f:197167-206994
MYVNHCLKIAQAFYNYIEKGLHYSNRAEFETCIKEICKQSHSKKITNDDPSVGEPRAKRQAPQEPQEPRQAQQQPQRRAAKAPRVFTLMAAPLPLGWTAADLRGEVERRGCAGVVGTSVAVDAFGGGGAGGVGYVDVEGQRCAVDAARTLGDGGPLAGCVRMLGDRERACAEVWTVDVGDVPVEASGNDLRGLFVQRGCTGIVAVRGPTRQDGAQDAVAWVYFATEREATFAAQTMAAFQLRKHKVHAHIRRAEPAAPQSTGLPDVLLKHEETTAPAAASAEASSPAAAVDGKSRNQRMADKAPEDIICHCNQVTKATITEAIAHGCKTVEEIGEKTTAGTSCGGCIPDIAEILEECHKTAP